MAILDDPNQTPPPWGAPPAATSTPWSAPPPPPIPPPYSAPPSPGWNAPGPVTPPKPTGADADANALPPDLIGDVPPPPVPMPPIVGPGIAGIQGTEAGTLGRPGTRSTASLHSSSYAATHAPRFGPGTPEVGGGETAAGIGGLTPEQLAEILRSLAAGRQPPPQ